MNKKKKNKNIFRFNIMWIYFAVLLVLGAMFFMDLDIDPSKQMSWNEFKELIKDEKSVSSITVDKGNTKAIADLEEGAVSKYFSNVEKQDFLKSKNYKIESQIPSVDKFTDFIEQNNIQTKLIYKEAEKGGFLSMLLYSFGPILLIMIFWFFMMNRGASSGGGGSGIFSVGKSKAKMYDGNNMKITFKDVAGLKEAKEEIEEIVHFLKNPSKYTQLGGKIPKGALLVGSPGTGKTLLAKAVAGEANVPFFSLSGSDFVEMFVGVGASRVRDLFQKAKEKAPCIIFIDEIDAVGRARGKNNNFGGNDERENTLNQLLTEMDGFGTNSGIIVLAATNRVDILDSALLRAGRFDRQIHVDLPDVNDRKEIFQVHLRGIKIDESLDLDLLSRQTPGFSGADIANVCNEAALIAARRNADVVSKDDFMNAVDRIVGGLEKKNRITTEEERQSIAIHEAGHATVSWHLEYGNPLVKVTIVPRGKALGAAWYLPEERQITTTQALEDQICSLLAGRAAEDIYLGRISTGAANDLERVTKIAYAMVTYYGMSDKLPNLNYYSLQNDGYNFSKPFSEQTSELIDKEVQNIINTQYERAKSIIKEHSEGHQELTKILLEREIIYREDVVNIFGERKWVSRADLIDSLNKEPKATELSTEDSINESAPNDEESKEETKDESLNNN